VTTAAPPLGVAGPGADASADPTAHLTAGRRRLVLAAMCLALVLVVAGVSMLNVALPSIARDLGTSQSEQQWIVDAYALALAALLLPAGAIGDRFGRRKTLLAGIVLFGIASGLAAFADTANSLIALRALAGIGAALIMPGTLSTITSVFPEEERAKAVGVWAGFAGSGALLGLLASGALLEGFWWGSVFLVNAVVALVALVVVLFAVPETSDPDEANLDPLGAVFSLLGFGGLVLGITEGPERGWGDSLTLLGLVGGTLFLTAFVIWELRSKAPMLDPRLFRIRGFATGSASLFFQFLAMFGFFFVALQFLQLVLGYGTFKASLALLPMGLILLPVSSLAAGFVDRWGTRAVGGAGLSITAVGFLVISLVNADSSYWHFLGGILITGFGMALAMTPATNAIVQSLPRARQGVASAVNDTARELGAAFGIAVLGSAFNSAYRSSISDNVAGLPPEAAEAVRESPIGAFGVAGELGADGADLIARTRDAFADGMQAALLFGAAVLVVGALFMWLRGPGRGELGLPESVVDDRAVADPDEDADFDLGRLPEPSVV
jgi:EmrB/QacA subfamily drug resistance transporter